MTALIIVLGFGLSFIGFGLSRIARALEADMRFQYGEDWISRRD